MGKKDFKVTGTKLTFEFENEEAADHFKSWLCGQGEQDYWGWMEHRELKEKGKITGVAFDYWKGSTVKVECGRLDDDR